MRAQRNLKENFFVQQNFILEDTKIIINTLSRPIESKL